MDHTAESIATSITVALTFISLIAGLFLAWYFYLKAKQKERLALIEKASEGIDFTKLFERPKKQQFRFKFPWLKLGILIFSITFGVAIKLLFFRGMDDDYAPLFGFMFGGIGMIAAHFADRRKDGE